ncbi:MAG: PAS domain-containing protein, partial [Kiritimatiellae bacterium]|nr:PAS domain-containing protein [Kiritimatiellia bacterium]
MGHDVILGSTVATVIAVLVVSLRAYQRLRAELSRLNTEFANHLNAKNAVIRDLESQRDTANSNLRVHAELNRILKNVTHDMVFVHRVTNDGLPGTIVEANDLTCQTLGRPRDMLLGMTPLDFEVTHTALGAPGYRTAELAAMSDTEIVKRSRALTLRDGRSVIRELLEKKHATFEREYEARDGRRVPVRVSAHLLEVGPEPLVVCAAHD